MYNLYINTTEAENKGTFTIPYTHKPLYFEPGTKIAFNNGLVYNAINNISAARGNNVIYILVGKSNVNAETIKFEDKLPTITGTDATEHIFHTYTKKITITETTRTSIEYTYTYEDVPDEGDGTDGGGGTTDGGTSFEDGSQTGIGDGTQTGIGTTFGGLQPPEAGTGTIVFSTESVTGGTDGTDDPLEWDPQRQNTSDESVVINEPTYEDVQIFFKTTNYD